MRILSLVCMVSALGVFLLGLIIKYILPVKVARPASFLQLTGLLLLLSINFAILTLMKKK